MAKEHDDWCRAVLGFNPAEALSHAASAVLDTVEAGGHALAAAGTAVVDEAKAIGTGIVQGGEAVLAGAEALGKRIADAVGGGHAPAPAPAPPSQDPDQRKFAALDDAFEVQMKRLEAQIKRLTDGGLDASHPQAQVKQFRADHDAAKANPNLQQRTAAITALKAEAKTEADQATADTDRGTRSAVEGIDKAVTDMRDAAKKLIDKLPKDNDDKPELNQRLQTLDAQIVAEAKLTDRNVRNKMLKQIERVSEALLDAAAKAAKDPDAVQTAYKSALLDRYGFTIDDTHGVSTHNDQVYKMFDMVPDTDVTQDKLTMLQYSTKMPGGAHNPSAFYWGGDETHGPEITMGQYSGTEELPYQDPTTKVAEKPNAFSISTLHELGHSVDDRYGLMSKHGGKGGGGGWISTTVDVVAKLYIDRFKAGPGKTLALADDKLLAWVEAALSTGKGARRPDMTDADWQAVGPLMASCASRKAGSPWETEDDIGGRSYHHSGNGWVSYLTASRAMALSVSKYQWRSPAEFFAELYAWTYYNSKAPPGPVEPPLKDYMYAGASGTQPAAPH